MESPFPAHPRHLASVPTCSPDPGATAPHEVPSEPVTGEPNRALLASNDPLLTEACREILLPPAWILVTVAEPGEATELAAHGGFGLVVLDSTLSALPVPLILRRARKQHPRPLVLVAGPDHAGRTVSLVEAGADELLPHLQGAPGCGGTRRLLQQRLSTAAAAAETRRIRTELSATQHSLVLQRAFFEHLFESAPEGIVVLDEKNRVLRANSEFCNMFGYTHPEILGRCLNDLIAPEPYSSEAAMLTARVRGNEQVATETTRCRRDGTQLEVSLLSTPIRTRDGQAGTIAIYRDITEQKRAQRALRTSEERYRYLFERNPHPMLIYDTETLRFLAVNETAVEQYGYSREELLAMTVLDIRPPEDVEAFRQHLSRAFPRIRLAGLWRHLRRDGSVIWVDVISLSIDFSGRPARLVMASDVTQRQVAEMRLQEQARELERVNEELKKRTRELEEALQSRSRLYAAMNHELRTPISAIMLFNDLLLSGTLGRLTNEQLDGVEQSQTAARHLLDLVNDVLDLARVQAGKISLKPVEFVLGRFLDEFIMTAKPLAASRGSSLILRSPPASCSLYSDPRRLRQILLNLISNAAKFGGGKPIEIVCSCECDIGGGAQIRVIDQGPGIAPEDQARIFEDFVQVGGHSQGGSGLGLAIARRLAELLGGTLDVESSIDDGSEFRLVLPARIPARGSERSTSLPFLEPTTETPPSA